MLSAYIAGLKAYRVRSKDKGKKQGAKRPSLDGWDQALQSAELARTRFREAEGQRKDGDIHSADMTVNGALVALHMRYYFHSSARLISHPFFCLSTGAVPTMYKSDLIMMGWDDEEVGKA